MAALTLHCFSRTIDIPAGLRRQPLEVWRTSARLTGVLRRCGVRVLGDLHGRKVGDFAWERNCGIKTLQELEEFAREAARNGKRNGNVSANGNGTHLPGGNAIAIPGSLCHLRFSELPLTKRLANVIRSIGAQTLGDLNGRSGFELLQFKQCGWRTLGEIGQLIERAISGEFDEVPIEESKAAAELLTLLEQGIAKLSPCSRQFLLARIGGESRACGTSLSYAEIGRRCGLTRSRVQQVVARAVENLRKTWGPRVPRLLEMIKRRCLSMVCPLTPALLRQWISVPSGAFARADLPRPGGGKRGESPSRFRLSIEAQVRLIALLDEAIPCWPEKPARAETHRRFQPQAQL